MGGIYSRIAILDNKSGWRVKHLYNLSDDVAFLGASENLGEGFNPNSSEINIKLVQTSKVDTSIDVSSWQWAYSLVTAVTCVS